MVSQLLFFAAPRLALPTKLKSMTDTDNPFFTFFFNQGTFSFATEGFLYFLLNFKKLAAAFFLGGRKYFFYEFEMRYSFLIQDLFSPLMSLFFTTVFLLGIFVRITVEHRLFSGRLYWSCWMKVSNRHRRWGGFPQNGDELRHAMGRSLVACCFRRYFTAVISSDISCHLSPIFRCDRRRSFLLGLQRTGKTTWCFHLDNATCQGFDDVILDLEIKNTCTSRKEEPRCTHKLLSLIQQR